MRQVFGIGALMVVVLATGCGGVEARPAKPSPAAAGNSLPAKNGVLPAAAASPGGSLPVTRPAAGALPFGATVAAVEKVLGAARDSHEVQGVTLRTYACASADLQLGFYRDMLSGVVLVPKAPWEWSEAEAWTKVFLPTFQAQKVLRGDAAEWSYFEEIRVRQLPFEAGFSYDRDEAGAITRIEGRINWLD